MLTYTSNYHRYAYSEEVGEESDEEAHSLTSRKGEGDISLVKQEKNVGTNDDFEQEDDEEEDKREWSRNNFWLCVMVMLIWALGLRSAYSPWSNIYCFNDDPGMQWGGVRFCKNVLGSKGCLLFLIYFFSTILALFLCACITYVANGDVNRVKQLERENGIEILDVNALYNTCVIMIVSLSLDCHVMPFLLYFLASNVIQFVQLVQDVPSHLSSQNT